MVLGIQGLNPKLEHCPSICSWTKTKQANRHLPIAHILYFCQNVCTNSFWPTSSSLLSQVWTTPHPTSQIMGCSIQFFSTSKPKFPPKNSSIPLKCHSLWTRATQLVCSNYNIQKSVTIMKIHYSITHHQQLIDRLPNPYLAYATDEQNHYLIPWSDKQQQQFAPFLLHFTLVRDFYNAKLKFYQADQLYRALLITSVFNNFKILPSNH